MERPEADGDSAPVEVRPGQLWRWSFNVGDGAWFLWRATTDARTLPGAFAHEFIVRGDVFTVVHPDDPGPYKLPHFDCDPDNFSLITPPPGRYHVVLLRDALVWIQHDWLTNRLAELVTDT